MASSSSSSFPFTFRVDPPPSTHTNFEFDQHQARPVALSREEKRRRRRLREERDGEKAIAMGGSDEYEHGHEQKRSWGGMFSAEEGKEVDSGEPPVKKRRGIAITLVDGVVSAALVGTAVGLTAYRFWRDRGKQLPPDDFPPPPPRRPQLLAGQPHVYAAADQVQNEPFLDGEERALSSLRSPPPSYYRQEDFVTAPSTPSDLYPQPTTTTSTVNFNFPPERNPPPLPQPFTRPPLLLPSRSSFLPPAGLDSHIDNLTSKLQAMMDEARLALSAPIARFAQEEEKKGGEDAGMVEEEEVDGGRRWRNLD